MTSGIYAIRNIRSGRVYVGSAVNIRRRFNQHRHMLRRGNHHSRRLQGSWDKHGEDCFVFEIIEFCDAGVLATREQFWIDELASTSSDRGMNIRPDATSNAGVKRSPEFCAAISARQKGRNRPDDEKRRISEGLKGRPVSPETRQKLADGRRGKVASDETRAKISAANRSRSDATLEKLRASSAVRWSKQDERERYRVIGKRLASLRWGKKDALQTP